MPKSVISTVVSGIGTTNAAVKQADVDLQESGCMKKWYYSAVEMPKATMHNEE